MRTTWLSILLVVCCVSTAFGQRDAPVWEAYIPKLAIYHEDNNKEPALTIDFLFKKNGGPHEHTEHQAYVLVYLKKDEAEIMKLAADPELVKKKNEQTKLFLDLLVEKKLVVPLDSQVAKINRTPRFPDVKGNPKPSAADTIDEYSFAFKFTLTNETLFKSVGKLGNFDPQNVNVVGSFTWFNDKFKLMILVPVNDSRLATKVSSKIHEMYDFANVMDFNTALLYFRPLPYELSFKNWDGGKLVYIN